MVFQRLESTPTAPRARLFKKLSEQADIALASFRVLGPKGWRNFRVAPGGCASEGVYRWNSLLVEFSTRSPVAPASLQRLRRRYRRRLQHWVQDQCQREVSTFMALFRLSLGREIHRGLCQWTTALELLSSWLSQELAPQERQEAQAELRELSRQMAQGVRALYDKIQDHAPFPWSEQKEPIVAEALRMLHCWDPGLQVDVDSHGLRCSSLQRSRPHLEELARCLQFISGLQSKVAQGELVIYPRQR